MTNMASSAGSGDASSSAAAAATSGGNSSDQPLDIEWCFSQIKGAVDAEEVSEGKQGATVSSVLQLKRFGYSRNLKACRLGYKGDACVPFRARGFVELRY